MDTSEMLDFVRDEAFAALWRRCCRESVVWDEFRALPQPAGMSAEDTYSLVAALQHRSGTILPFGNYMPQVSGPDNWFYETVEMHRLVRSVVAETRAGSELDLAIRGLPARVRMALLAKDFSAACWRDGIELGERAAREVLAGTRSPSCAAETLARNFARTLPKVPGLAGRRVSAGMLEMLWESLTEDVAAQTGAARRYMVAEKKPTALDDPDAALAMVVRLMSSTETSEINAVVRSFLAGGVFWDYDPFPWANSVMEILARMLLVVNEGLPALAYVPCSDAFARWERGQISSAGTFIEPIHDLGEGFDSTAHFTGKLRIVSEELAALKTRVARVEESEAGWRRTLEEDRRLNPRQRDVLLAALHDPGSRFLVADHRRIHGVGYATARKDLVDLEQMGLLARCKEGHAYCYAATSRLVKLVSTR